VTEKLHGIYFKKARDKIILTGFLLIVFSLFICIHLQIGPSIVDATPFQVQPISKGGTNRTTACADGEMLLSDGTDYDCLVDEIGDPDPGGNTSWDMALTTLTIDGTNYNCIFSDGDLTCTGDGGITAPKFTTSGGGPYVLCTNASAEAFTTAGKLCTDSGDENLYWYQGTTAYGIGPASTNIAIDATDGTNSITVTDTEIIWANDDTLLDTSANNPAAATNVCSGDVYLPFQFKAYAGDGQEGVKFSWYTPHDLDATAGIKIQLILIQSSDTEPVADEGMEFEVAGCSISGNESGDCTIGAVTEITDADLSGDTSEECDIWYTAQTAAITNITGLAANEVTQFTLVRDFDDPDDDYVQDIGVVGIVLEYKLVKDNTY
jgi:hypothetical protein